MLQQVPSQEFAAKCSRQWPQVSCDDWSRRPMRMQWRLCKMCWLLVESIVHLIQDERHLTERAYFISACARGIEQPSIRRTPDRRPAGKLFAADIQ
jgi:hypothetical protein